MTAASQAAQQWTRLWWSTGDEVVDVSGGDRSWKVWSASGGGAKVDKNLVQKPPCITIQITKPEIEALIKQRLQSGEFKDAEDVILQALKSSEIAPRGNGAERAAAIQRLKTFGKTHRLSLGGMTIKDLLHESRP